MSGEIAAPMMAAVQAALEKERRQEIKNRLKPLMKAHIDAKAARKKVIAEADARIDEAVNSITRLLSEEDLTDREIVEILGQQGGT